LNEFDFVDKNPQYSNDLEKAVTYFDTDAVIDVMKNKKYY
jgi:hypothetical protein